MSEVAFEAELLLVENIPQGFHALTRVNGCVDFQFFEFLTQRLKISSFKSIEDGRGAHLSFLSRQIGELNHASKSRGHARRHDRRAHMTALVEEPAEKQQDEVVVNKEVEASGNKPEEWAEKVLTCVVPIAGHLAQPEL